MNYKTLLGWVVLLSISFTPVLLWALFSGGLGELSGYASITHILGELFGLVGMMMFALTFILSARISFIEDVFGGLDKVYIVHGILGGFALVFIMAHPILLVLKFVPSEIYLAAEYLLPSSYWSVNYGIISLVGMLILIALTLFTSMKYNRWKFTHEFLGLMFAFAVLHVFTVRGSVSQDYIFTGYNAYALAVSLIGLFGFSYSLFLKNRLFKNAVYSIKSIQRKNDSFGITLTPEHKPISYMSGQFIFVRFYNESISKEAHPFSIASSSNSNDILIIVKELGDYTSKLVNLNTGDKVSVEGPYGRFNHRMYSKGEQVWIAGGIGITPFIGMAQDIVEGKSFKDKITLIYSVKRMRDMIGGNLFERISRANSKFTFIPWVSQSRGWLTAKAIIEACGGVKDKHYFICGPLAFKEGIIKDLVKNGVKRGRIHAEAFDFR